MTKDTKKSEPHWSRVWRVQDKKQFWLKQAGPPLERFPKIVLGSGRIVGYDVSTSAVAGGQEVASQNRLTMQVQLRYVHLLDPTLDFEQTFSRFADFPATSDLFDVEGELVEEINEQLTQEVFNASLGNW